jgi:hydroxymethylpyrimidine/phosphomethylpyrimidine kinase
VQNSLRVEALTILDAAFVQQQIATLTADIRIHAVKTGMLLRPDIIEVVAAALGSPALSGIPVVIDPVFVAGDGRRFVSDEAVEGYKARLFPRASVITPNLDEAAILTGRPVHTPWTVDAMRAAAHDLYALGSRAVLVKGGHLPASEVMVDVLYDGQTFHELRSPYLPAHNPRGTGCTFASCMAAEMAKGASVIEAGQTAKYFVGEALRGALGWQIGEGRGTLYHSVHRPPITAGQRQP